MARQRDYRAEYAARKARAKAAGYTGVTEYSRARKGLPRGASPLPKSAKLYAESDQRRRAYKWSRTHSHSARSRYTASMSDKQVTAFLDAFDVTWGHTKAERRERLEALHDYLMEYDDDFDEGDWDESYEDK